MSATLICFAGPFAPLPSSLPLSSPLDEQPVSAPEPIAATPTAPTPINNARRLAAGVRSSRSAMLLSFRRDHAGTRPAGRPSHVHYLVVHMNFPASATIEASLYVDANDPSGQFNSLRPPATRRRP